MGVPGIKKRKNGKIYLNGTEVKNRFPKDAIENGFALPTEERRATGIFGGLDPAMLLSLMEMFGKMNTADDNERFLLALKPLLRDENKEKIDTALKFMKIFALLPILRESGLLGKLF